MDSFTRTRVSALLGQVMKDTINPTTINVVNASIRNKILAFEIKHDDPNVHSPIISNCRLGMQDPLWAASIEFFLSDQRNTQVCLARMVNGTIIPYCPTPNGNIYGDPELKRIAAGKGVDGWVDQFGHFHDDRRYKTLPYRAALARYVYCAAMQDTNTGSVIVSVRHFDSITRGQLQALKIAKQGRAGSVQGFIDNHGEFLNRSEALALAKETGVYDTFVSATGHARELFSEDLY